MNIIKTPIEGLFVIEPNVFEDSRGYFFESYNKSKLSAEGIECVFVQDNESCSELGVVRGLHYQLEPYSQVKLVRVIVGSVFDVAVDLRKDSPTFGQHYGLVLSAENKKQMYIPKGFAHGFSVLSDKTVFSYKCSDFYNASSERGIRFDDPKFNIDWKVGSSKISVSEKDLVLPFFDNAEKNFKHQNK